MVGNRSTGLSLFELLARVWTLGNEIEQIEFSHDDSTALFRLSSGKLAMMKTRDEESSGRRTRVHIDTGQTTISQRKNPIPAVTVAKATARSGLPVVRCGPGGFLTMDVNGSPCCLSDQGESAIDIAPGAPEITALCSSHTGDTLALARQDCVSVHWAKDMSVIASVSLSSNITCMAFSSCGKFLATWGDGSLGLLDIMEPNAAPSMYRGVANVTQLEWSKSASHIACASSANEFHIIDVQAGTVQTVTGYPDHVSCATFSVMGKALVTSGAFRVAGWAIDDLPHDDLPGTPLTTGKPGLVVVKTIAAHPERALVAAGYANGLVTIASIASTQEMMVHKEAGTEVTRLQWSSSGEHLAIGFKSGKAALVTFPDRLFK